MNREQPAPSRGGQPPDGAADPALLQAFLERFNAGRKPAAGFFVAPQPTPLGIAKPEFGQLWATKSEVEVLDGRRWTTQRIEMACDAMILEGPIETPFDDTIFRAAACTPALAWPVSWQTDRDVRVTVPGLGDYVVHLWLEYPVSQDQLAACLGNVTDADAENLEIGRVAVAEGLPLTSQERAGLPLHDKRDGDLLLELENLQERADSLDATATTRRLWVEGFNRVKTVFFGIPVAPAKQFIERAVPVPAFSGGAAQQRQVRGLVWAGLLDDLTSAITSKADLAGARPFRAMELVPVQSAPAGQGACLGQWEITENLPELKGGEAFYVYDAGAGKVIGAGVVEIRSGAPLPVANLRSGQVEDFPQGNSIDLTLLIPIRP